MQQHLTRRLARSMSGTNLERAGDYNQRTVLQLIRLRGVSTRVELAQQTGLTAPTIANITNRLIELDFLRHIGRTLGGRGQPAMRMEINPDGAFGIGVNIDRDHLSMAIVDLAGEVRSKQSLEIAFAMPGDVAAFVKSILPRLLKAGRVDRDRVLGVGVAIPDDLGRIELPHRPAQYGVWDELDLAGLLSPVLPWSLHSDNDAAAAALGEAQCSTALNNPTFFYLLISAGLGGGPVIDRIYHRGATSRSGEIGLMPDPTSSAPDALVQDTVSLSALKLRLSAAGVQVDALDDLARPEPAAAKVIECWLEDATRSLTQPLVALAYLLNLDAIVIGGRLPVQLIQRLAGSLEAALATYALPLQPKIMPAAMAEDAPAIGAAMLPFLDHVLPSEAILMQAGRG